MSTVDVTDEVAYQAARQAKVAELRANNFPPLDVKAELVINWDKTHHQDGTPISDSEATTISHAREIKSREMWLDGKSNPNIVFTEDATTIHRYFIDTAAAQEWADFITALAATHSLKTPQCEIRDRVIVLNMVQATQDRNARATTPGDPSSASGADW